MEIRVEIKLEEKGKFLVNCSNAAKIYVDLNKDSAAGCNPLELFLSSLASCVGVYANKYLTQHSIEFSDLKIYAQAELSQSPPMRLINIKIKVYTDAKLDNAKKEVFLRFVRNCPVHNTIIHTKEIDINLA